MFDADKLINTEGKLIIQRGGNGSVDERERVPGLWRQGVEVNGVLVFSPNLFMFFFLNG